MLRRILIGIVCLCLLTGTVAHAQAEALSAAELTSWLDSLWARLQGEAVQNDPELTFDETAAAQWMYIYDFAIADLYEKMEDADENPIAEVELLTDGAACPRGISVGMPLSAVLDAYPNENPDLAGTTSYAALYTVEEGDTCGWGWVMRQNQLINAVEYAVSVPVAGMDGYRQVYTLLYIIENGMVSSIRAGGFDALVTAEESGASLQSMKELMADESYLPTQMADSADLSADTLTVASLPFISTSLDALAAALGVPLDDSVSSTQTVRTLTYEDILIEATGGEGAWKLEAVLVTGDTVEGPGGIRVGDTMAFVLERLGPGDTEDGLMYSFTDDAGNGYMLACSFFEDVLTEYLLYRI